jgi:hypothetical protein
LKSSVFWDKKLCSLVEFYWLLEEPIASIFRVEALAKQGTISMQGMLASFALCSIFTVDLLFDPEDRGSTFFRSSMKLLPYYTVALPRTEWYFS